MAQDSLNITDSSNKVTITLHANPFDSDTYVGSVTRQTINLNALAARISENDTGLSAYTVLNVAGQLKKETLKAIQRGQAVNVLGLGTLYMVPDGTISVSSPNDALSKKLTLRFSPSSAALEAVEDVKANVVTVSNPAPQITSLESLPKVDGENVFSAGKAVYLTGEKLKIAGDDSGIFLCKTDEDGNVTNGNQIQVADDLITRNKMKEIEFFIPSDVESGDYKIKLSTRYINGASERKNIVNTLSNVITIQ